MVRRRAVPGPLAGAAAATPAGRDRLVDLVRAASILVVVLGHWTMAALAPAPGGGLRVRNILEVSSWAHPLTWLFQVMPLFFLASGFTNALALRRPGQAASAVVSARVLRVLRPTVVFVAAWLVLALVLEAVGVPHALVDAAGAAAAMPLWFLAVYLLLALVAPVQFALHARTPWLLTGLLPVVALLLDQAQGTAVAAVGYLNYVVVFGFCQELGFLYADGRLARVRRHWWAVLAAGAAGLLWLLTGPGPYPVSMIGLPGQEVSNMLPPSVCVTAVAVLQLGLVMLARPALLRWAHRRGPWRATVAVNSVVMTLFLWHITGLVLVAGSAYLLGLSLPVIGSARWWLEKPLWVLGAAVVTAALVAALRGVEQAPPSRTGPRPLAVPAALLSVAGLTMVACAGFVDPLTRGGVALAGVTFYPAVGAGLLLLGWLLARRTAA
jgi:fucose 4-O-acetylase-like acetyltransferase